MASATPVYIGNKKFQHYTLYDTYASTSNGVWIDVRSWKRISLELTISSATAQIYASLAATKPANSTDGVQVGSDITASSIISLPDKYAWIKIKVTANSGTISAYALGESSVYGVC